MDRGDLVPDELVINICKAEMDTEEAKKKGWLLDGMPRTAVQAGALNNMGLVPNLFLMLECPDAVMIERACGRRMDPVTRKIYHLKVGERSLSPRNVPSLSRARATASSTRRPRATRSRTASSSAPTTPRRRR